MPNQECFRIFMAESLHQAFRMNPNWWIPYCLSQGLPALVITQLMPEDPLRLLIVFSIFLSTKQSAAFAPPLSALQFQPPVHLY